MLFLSCAMSSSDDIGHRQIVADRHARMSKIFDGKWLAGMHEVMITEGSCTLSPNFQIDTDTRSCAFTHLGITYNGSLQQDGLSIKWSDESTWTLVKPTHADEDEPPTTTESADSECSNKRRRLRKRTRHRKKRHHRIETHREDDSTSNRDSRNTHGNTVHLTHASTWRPHSPPLGHTKRKHAAGALPDPHTKKPSKTTTEPPAPHQTHLPLDDKDKQVDTAFALEPHLIATHQPLADSSSLIVQLPLCPCDFNGNWSTSSYTTATITRNTCDLFQSFACTPNWRTCFGELGTRLYVGKLSDDGRVIRWSNGNTWIRLDSLRLAVKQHCDPDPYSREDQPERSHHDLTWQHPLSNHPQHHTPHRTIGLTHASTKPSKTKAKTRPPDTPHSKKPPLHSATLTATHPTTIMGKRVPKIESGAFEDPGSKTYTEQFAAAQQQLSTKQQHKHTPAKPQWHRPCQFIYLSTSTQPPQYHRI